MTRKTKPSEAETEILNILWDHQPSLVKDIHEHLSRRKSVGYTTTLKQVQRLLDKGLVTREPGPGKSYLYSAAVGEEETKTRLFDRFVETTFSNSVSELVMHALGSGKPSDEEIAQIKKFLETMERQT